MSNLKRTVLYSATVVALGLGAVVSIYSDMQNKVGFIEPAAGVEADAGTMTAPVLEKSEYSSEINTVAAAADSAMDNMVSEAEESADAVLAEIEAIMNAVEAEDASMDGAAEMIETIAPAAGHEHDDHHGDEPHEEEEDDNHADDHETDHDEHGDDHH